MVTLFVGAVERYDLVSNGREARIRLEKRMGLKKTECYLFGRFVAIWEQDDPAVVAAAFVATHSLGQEPRAQLEQMLRTQQAQILGQRAQQP